MNAAKANKPQSAGEFQQLFQGHPSADREITSCRTNQFAGTSIAEAYILG
jgi:hypothetical protein